VPEAEVGVDDGAVVEVTDELYAVDPAEFVAGRDRLVKRLRAEGNRELAATVAKLRRPSPAAWAVNQLARRDPEGVADLVRRGDELRTAQAHALAGAHPDELREAARARRDAVAALSDVAVGLLAERGAGADTHRNQISATLEAASLDPEAGAAVQRGRLSTALEPPSGFGDSDEVLFASVPASSGPRGESVDTAARAAAEARRLARGLATQAKTLAERASRRRRELEDAEGEVTTLERRLADARRRRDEAAEAAREAEAAAAQAEDAAAAAQASLEEG
jgi:hypothetical protein